MIAACDIRLCSQSAFFSIKEVDIGIAADMGSLQRLPRLVGNHSQLRRWALTGMRVHADEALAAGLVSQVLQTRAALLETAFLLARTIAAKSPVAVIATKAVLNHALDHTIRDGLDYVAKYNGAAFQTEVLRGESGRTCHP